jgi:diphthine-ammonia ligase
LFSSFKLELIKPENFKPSNDFDPFMRLAALFSGGKDSTYAAHLAENDGHNITNFVSVQPLRDDSWMFHSVNSQITPLLAEAMGKHIVTVPTSGEKELELDDLLLALVKISIDGVVTGAIASYYQKKRVDEICTKLGLLHYAPLWGMDPEKVLTAEISSGMNIIFTAVAARGLDASWLGRKLDFRTLNELRLLHTHYGLNICGEGGEYETLVTNAPWFISKLDILKTEIVWDGISGKYLVKDASLRKN